MFWLLFLEEVCEDVEEESCIATEVEKCEIIEEEVCEDVSESVCTPVMDMTCSDILETECHDVEETECRVMMVKECRWMEQEVCSGGGGSPRGYQPPARQARGRNKKDPIQDLLQSLSNIVQTFLEPIGKLINHNAHSARQPRCKWVPKEWCEERPKEWCEPITKQKCNQVNNIFWLLIQK